MDRRKSEVDKNDNIAGFGEPARVNIDSHNYRLISTNSIWQTST